MTTEHLSFSRLLSDVRKRSTRAVISQLGVRSKDLRDYLVETIGAEPGDPGSFLADPVFEATFGWQEASISMEELAARGEIVPELINAMDSPPGDIANEYRFNKNWFPFHHQIRSWELLRRDEPQSVLVTSGTGSGKTECFLVPILDDLVRQQKESRLTGVSALFLYPLNALINSQRDRLRAWTAAFNGNIRFCLYNGETPERARSRTEREFPQEQRSRQALREDPASILVTNSTMLEYMLVRSEDAPIIEQSKGKLRWIVLDEAHSYVGSQAADLALLIRRVLHRFEVDPSDVRFVATSATIGGDSSEKDLKAFLKDVSGTASSRVHVVTGSRKKPKLEKQIRVDEPNLSQLSAMDAGNQFEHLAESRLARNIRTELQEGPRSLTDLTKFFPAEYSSAEMIRLLEAGTTASKDGEIFLPLRAHLFHRTMSGLWACVNRECTGRAAQVLGGEWGFGAVHEEKQDFCKHCGCMVLEIAVCDACGEEYLLAKESYDAKTGQISLIPRATADDVDEFQLDMDAPDEEVDDDLMDLVIGDHHVMVTSYKNDLEPIWISPGQFIVSNEESSGSPIKLVQPGPRDRVLQCLRCRERDTRNNLFWPLRIGGPFVLSSLIPTALENLPSQSGSSSDSFAGRRLLTFSDSRQGSARIAVRLQQESERNYIRSQLYHSLVANRSDPPSNESLKDLESQIADLEKVVSSTPSLKPILEEKQNELIAIEQQANPRGELTWQESAGALQNASDLNRMKAEYRRLTGADLATNEYSQFCLFREFFRRPKKMNSSETLGLLQLRYPALEQRFRSNMPPAWAGQLGGSSEEWVSFLKVLMDFFVRALSAVDIPDEYLDWMGVSVRKKYIQGPGYEGEVTPRQVRWPQARPIGRVSRIVRLLATVFELNLSDASDRDAINEILASAWRNLRASLRAHGDGYLFPLSEMASFSELHEAWICPYTRRILDTTLRGISPYTPAGSRPEVCTEILLPRLPMAFWRDPNGRHLGSGEIGDWLESNEDVLAARATGVWSNLNDRIAAGSSYFAVAEHSAQLAGSRLRSLEERFKSGDLNVLSCSTTMEMGVDIGGLSGVMMNNPPPSPANYLQRVGRAGRRNEGAAFGITLCKHTPHGSAIFHNPKWPFEANFRAPRVALDSSRLVQRHINALCLTSFLRGQDVRKLQSGWFFEPSENLASPADVFVEWCYREAADTPKLTSGIMSLVKGSALEPAETKNLLAGCAQAMFDAASGWLAEIVGLQEESDRFSSQPNGENSPGFMAIARQLRRAREEYLLSELVRRSFLPGYGFPTNIVPFLTTTMDDLKRRDDFGGSRDESFGQRSGFPTRQAPVAIRDYAPGADVVIDGKVYRSDGLTLNWHIPAGAAEVNETQSFRVAWQCRSCGGTGSSATVPDACLICDAESSQVNYRSYIEPAGFAVDIRYKAHNDVTSPAYLRPRDPWISCPTESWVSLPNPETGRYRQTERGHIFHYNAGYNDLGYVVCLKCGRAKEETESGNPLLEHTRLRGGRDADGTTYCEGNDSDWAIKRNVTLGFSQHTDVFELQLNATITSTAAYSLAVVMRKALADVLGVEEQEMGVAALPSRLPSGEVTTSIFVFDGTTSSTGYTLLLAENLAEVLRRAHKYLRCANQCDRACHGCLLTAETQFRNDQLDRHAALEVLDGPLVNALELSETSRFFGSESRIHSGRLPLAVRQLVRGGLVSRIRAFWSDEGSRWDIPELEIYRDLQAWAAGGMSVEICVSPKSWDSLSLGAKHLMASLEEANGISWILQEPPGTPEGDGTVAVEIESAGNLTRFAVSSNASLAPGVGWGATDEGSAIIWHRAAGGLKNVSGKVLAPADLRPKPENLVAEIRLSRELDGPLAEFGTKFWSTVLREIPTASEKISKHSLLEVEYRDRYLRSPWSLILLRELISSLVTVEGLITGSTKFVAKTFPLDTRNRRAPYAIDEDWLSESEATRTSFVELGFDRAPSGLAWPGTLSFLSVWDDVPHFRELSLRWDDGQTWIINLDQGLGYWSPDIAERYPAEASVGDQIRWINNNREKIRVNARRPKYPTIIYVGGAE